MSKIFISYSHQDKGWKDRLVKQLGVLEMGGDLEIWVDSRIKAGADWEPELEKALNEAAIAILLISADFLTSDFILKKEVPSLLKHRREKGVRVIPLIIEPCPWQKIKWLSAIQVLPTDGHPLSTKAEHEADTALTALAEEIHGLISQTPGSTAAATATATQEYLFPDKITLSKLPTTGHEIFGREKELELLDDAWATPHTHILSFVAWGGVGKTALVNEWLTQMEEDNYRGAERVYGWSFYSQGTGEERQVSADEFINHALQWFGDEDHTQGSPWDKGVRLAGLIRKQRTLLILDGLEPLQYSPGEMQGRLKDQGMQALLKELARSQPGLCIISTREGVEDIEHTVNKTTQRIHLEHLSQEAGTQLLKSLAVKGTEKELKAATKEFEGHALALTLLGSYLKTVHDGEIRKRDRIPRLTKAKKQGGHARRVMESYETWLKDTPELNILYLMGLFDRPASGGAIAVLRKEPAIKGLTNELQQLTEDDWLFALENLRELRLLAAKEAARPDTLDCHPLVREHFAEELRENNPQAWQEAHSRLYEYYKNLPEKELPDTLEEMEPLFAAVAHGCQAERQQETLDDVFWERIYRGNKKYSVKKLGAFGVGLAAISSFFETPWRQPVFQLQDSDKAFLLNEAGFTLRALGRLSEASEPIQAGLDNYIQQKNWEYAAILTGNLSELYLTIGEVGSAVKAALQSVEFADRSGDEFQKHNQREKLGNALHQSGKDSEARRLFRDAESIQKKSQPTYNYLYSMGGFVYCDLLLSRGEYREVLIRAKQTLEWGKSGYALHDFALDNLSLGRAHWLQAAGSAEFNLSASEGLITGATQKQNPADLTSTEEYLQRAVAGLREAGRQDYLPRALFAQAAFYRWQGEFASAASDLQEAREIAERGEMGLHLADYHLEACRLRLAQLGISDFGMRISDLENADAKLVEEAKEHLETAAKMIDKMGYHRRDPEVEALRKVLEESK